MSRNHYEAAFGVVPIDWQQGEPSPSAYVVLVEVWRTTLAAIDTTWAQPTRPQVQVEARIEVRVHANGAWIVVGYKGDLRHAGEGDVRRWAPLASRTWNATITLDGWDGAS